MKKRRLWLAIPIIVLATGLGIWSGRELSQGTPSADNPKAPDAMAAASTSATAAAGAPVEDQDSLIAERDRLFKRILDIQAEKAAKEGKLITNIFEETPAVPPPKPSVEDLRAEIASERAIIAQLEKQQP